MKREIRPALAGSNGQKKERSPRVEAPGGGSHWHGAGTLGRLASGSRLKEYTGGKCQAGRGRWEAEGWEEAAKKAPRMPWTKEELKSHYGHNTMPPTMRSIHRSSQTDTIGQLGILIVELPSTQQANV